MPSMFESMNSLHFYAGHITSYINLMLAIEKSDNIPAYSSLHVSDLHPIGLTTSLTTAHIRIESDVNIVKSIKGFEL